MTKYWRRIIAFLYADTSAFPPLFARGVQFLHMLESGNLEAAITRLSDVFIAETTDWIPAFAGMTKYCWRVVGFLCADSSTSPPLFVRGIQFLHTLFRGNDEVLSEGYRLPPRHFFGAPTVVVRDIRFLHTLDSIEPLPAGLAAGDDMALLPGRARFPQFAGRRARRRRGGRVLSRPRGRRGAPGSFARRPGKARRRTPPASARAGSPPGTAKTRLRRVLVASTGLGMGFFTHSTAICIARRPKRRIRDLCAGSGFSGFDAVWRFVRSSGLPVGATIARG